MSLSILTCNCIGTASAGCVSITMLRNEMCLRRAYYLKCLFSPVSSNRRPSGFVNFNLKTRQMAKFSRKPVRVYVPKTDGVVPAKGSLAKLPEKVNQTDDVQRSQTSGQLFKTLMGEILTTKSKRLIAVEGSRQVDDAISFGLTLRYLFLLKTLEKFPDNVRKIVSNNSKVPESSFGKFLPPEIHQISLSILQEWSSLQTPPGIIGIFDKPTSILQHASAKQNIPLTVVLDNIREPGNLGSIMRTAAGIGCKLLLSKGCVDPWEPKTLRGGNGAHFFVPMITKVELEHLYQYIPLPELQASAENTNESDTDFKKVNAGNRKGVGVFLADSGVDSDEFGIPIVNYTSVQYSEFESIVLILGGETVGLSSTMKNAVNDLPKYYPEEIKNISRIKIPMSLPIDSLNVANSFGIIGYEILRQLSSNS